MISRLALAAVLGLVVPTHLIAQDQPIVAIHRIDPDVPHHQPPDVQIALLLDTSNSMDGLINQARTQLWTIVNEFSRAKRDGKMPRIEVALYEYGNDTLVSGEGYIRQVLPLTRDLDRISEALFKLTTNGGSEYCGHVIQSAVEGLRWRNDPRTYKAIFIAGNEPFTQGQVDYKQSVARAIGQGIAVNTIHCGDDSTGRSGMWHDGARRGEGEYVFINQDRTCVAIEAPQDKIIIDLNMKLNTTYIPYGAAGGVGAERQVAQDALAQENAAAGAMVQRSVAKANSNYDNSHWDLCDAVCNDKIKIEDVRRDQLPQELQNLSEEQLATRVKEMSEQRTKLQSEINRLNAERTEYIAQEQNRQAQNGAEETLDSAAVKMVRTQLKAKGFEVEQ